MATPAVDVVDRGLVLEWDETSLAQRVIGSPVYARQVERARRTALRDDRVRAVLEVLAGGRASREAVAAAAGVPLLRFGGAMSSLRRVLNVEGYEVISEDPDGQTVLLDEGLLARQFEV